MEYMKINSISVILAFSEDLYGESLEIIYNIITKKA